MYERYYGLAESPFALTPDPRFLYLTDVQREAFASAVYGIQARRGFVLILGEVGTGKTTLIRYLLGRLPADVQTVLVFQPVGTLEELLHVVLRDLGVASDSRRRVDMIDALNDHILAEAGAGRSLALIIDEAQQLPATVLEELRLLSNIETADAKLLQVVLVGQPELADKLARPGLRQLRQRIGLIARLQALTARETARYVEHRLAVAGRRGGPLFTRPALARVYRASGGVPRLVNVVCDKALVLAYAASARRVRARTVRRVVEDWAVFERRGARLRAPSPWAERARGTRRPVIRLAAGLAASVAAALAWLQLGGYDHARLALRGPAAIAAGTPVLEPAPDGPGTAAPAARVPAPVEASGGPATPPEEPAASTAAGAGNGGPNGGPRDSAPTDLVVIPGDTLVRLVSQVYGRADDTLLDRVQAANPGLRSIDRIVIGRRLHFPRVDAAAMVERAGPAEHVLHLLTLPAGDLARVEALRRGLEEGGRRVSLVAVHLTGGRETWYRVVVGGFANPEQAEDFHRAFSSGGFEAPRGAAT